MSRLWASPIPTFSPHTGWRIEHLYGVERLRRREQVAVYSDPRELLREQAPDALAIFTPHLSHYRLTMDALQAGCHVFIEKPLTTNSQEAAESSAWRGGVD